MMRFPETLQARISAASTTVQQLVYDVIADYLMADGPQAPERDAWSLHASDEPTEAAPPMEITRLTAYLQAAVPEARRGAWPYKPDADAIAFAVGVIAGRTMTEIARFFGVEHQYCRTKLRRLREHAGKA